MGRRIWFFLLAGVIILVLVALAIALLAGGRGEVRTAAIRFVEGLVNVRLGGAEDFVAALVDMLLASGDELHTGQDGHSVLEMDDGMVVVVAPSSSFEVMEMEGGPQNALTRLILNAGEIFSISPGELPEDSAYEVITPAGVIGIRGSAMSALYDPETATVEATCLSGRCQVSAQERSLDLEGNQWIGLTPERGILGQPEPLTDEQIKRWGRALEKSREAGTNATFENQCTCEEVDLVCKDGARFERFPNCRFFRAETLRELRYFGGGTVEVDTPQVYTLLSGHVYGIDLSEVSGMDVEMPDGSHTFVRAWQGLGELVMGDSQPGEPELGGLYRFTLLDAAGQAIEGMSDEDIWQTCSLEAPTNIRGVITPEQDIEMSWDRVSGAQNYGVAVDRYPGGGKLYEGHPAGLKSSHVIPWSDLGPAEFSDGAVGESLGQLPDGDYSVTMFAYKRDCLAVNVTERLLITKLGERLDYFESARQPIPYGEAPSARTQMVIDGRAGDWAGREALYGDPAGDAEQGFLDLAAGYAFVNQQALYVMVEAVDPQAPVVQFDIEIWTPGRQYLLGWRPGEEGPWIADVTSGWRELGPAAHSSFWIDDVIEMRIDLRDLGQPEKLDLGEVRLLVGECCGDEWRAADVWKPGIVPVVNEADSPTPTIPYGETPQAETQILVDGDVGDWAGRQVVFDDPAGDAEAGFLDLTSGYAFANQQALYLLLAAVDPEADFVQFDIELQADDRRLLLSWRPENEHPGLTDISGGEFKGIGEMLNSKVSFGPALEARLDLRDLGLPETLNVKLIRVMVGECCGEAWRSADVWAPPLTPLVNEVDPQPPVIPYGEPPQAETQILVDGDAGDWAGRQVVFDDPAGDAEAGFLDLTSGYTFVNQQALYLLLTAVDPEADFAQFDIELQADDRRLLLSWSPASTTAYLSDISGGEFMEIGEMLNSKFMFGPALEARIDLRDLGLPETLSVKLVRVMVGECCGEAWRSADTWQAPVTPIVNEIDQ